MCPVGDLDSWSRDGYQVSKVSPTHTAVWAGRPGLWASVSNDRRGATPLLRPETLAAQGSGRKRATSGRQADAVAAAPVSALRRSTASRYSSTSRWTTAAVFSTRSSWPTTWPTGLNMTSSDLSA